MEYIINQIDGKASSPPFVPTYVERERQHRKDSEKLLLNFCHANQFWRIIRIVLEGLGCVWVGGDGG